MGDSHVGLHARLMSQALRKLTSVIHKSNTVAINNGDVREYFSHLTCYIVEHTSSLLFFVKRDVELLAWHNARATASAASSGLGADFRLSILFTMSIT